MTMHTKENNIFLLYYRMLNNEKLINPIESENTV